MFERREKKSVSTECSRLSCDRMMHGQPRDSGGTNVGELGSKWLGKIREPES